MTLSARRRIAFASITILLVVVALVGAILAADIWLHHKVEPVAGVNIWGYRGPRVGHKAPGERRIVVLGGSTAFGYGVKPEEAFPAYLERLLEPLARPGRSVRVVNLGMNSEGAYAFKFNLEDYAYLDYDLAILYEGYNDHGDDRNILVLRRESPIFRLTGYYPIFAMAFREKAMSIMWNGDIGAAYNATTTGKKTVFRPGIAGRATAAALDATADISMALDRQLKNVAKRADADDSVRGFTRGELGCPKVDAPYCTSEYDAITYLLAHGKKVIVVSQPYLGEGHVRQQESLRAMLAAKFAGNPNVHYVNLGPVLDKDGKDRELFYDGIHLVAAGNRVLAEHLVAPTAEMLSDGLHLPAERRP